MTAVLLLIGVLILASAAVALSLHSIIHSALLLIGSWLGVAFFYLWAGAEFVAFAQVLVYVGAVSMIVLFAVLLTRRTHADGTSTPATRLRAGSAVFIGACVATLITGAILSSPLRPATGPAPQLTVHDLGHQLAESHAVGLLIIGAILTVSLLGAVVLAAQETTKEDPK